MLYPITNPGRIAHQPPPVNRPAPLPAVGLALPVRDGADERQPPSRASGSTPTPPRLGASVLPSLTRRRWRRVAEPGLFATALMAALLFLSQWVNELPTTPETPATHTQVATVVAAAPR